MSDSKLSDLTAATSVAPADLAYVVQGGTSKKATREILQTYDAGTLTADKKVLDLSATWNAAGVTFTGVKFNVTNTASAAASKVFDFQIGGTSALVLTSLGNLLVGTGTQQFSFAGRQVIEVNGLSEAIIALKRNNSTSTSAYLYHNSSDFRIVNAENSPILFWTNNGEKMRLDASGNLGLGVTPSAWGGGFKAVDLNTYGAIGSTTGSTSIFGNAYYNGTNYIYKQTSAATFYDQALGLHRWWNAPSGTAGNTISFTQAMTLDASGNLAVGNTAPRGLLHVGSTASTNNIPIPSGNFAIVRGGDYGTPSTAGLQLSGGFGDAGSIAAWQIKAVASGTAGAWVQNLVFTSQNSFGGAETERMRLTNAGLLTFGGTTSSFPALKRSSTTLQVRLADDSGDAPLSGSAFTASGDGSSVAYYVGSGLSIRATASAANIYLDAGSAGSNGAFIFRTGSGLGTRFKIDSSNSVIVNSAALATTATDGFLYVPTCAGTPTGTPTTQTGTAPIVIDTTNNKLYFYSGGQWRDAGP